MEIIGLSGYARSGKDETANILVDEYGFTRVAFADKLREVVYQLNPLVTIKRADVPVSVKTASGMKRLMLDEETPSTIPVSIPVYLQDVIDNYGWDGYKASEYGKEIRRLLQRMGTEAGRQTLWDSIWVDAAFASTDAQKIVVTDCRFPNEAAAIRERGGVVWRVQRAGVGPATSEDGTIHKSETSLDDYRFDMVLFNDCALETYKDKVRRVYARRK